jgi:PIN domain nuclease of toxin-antitoxin system
MTILLDTHAFLWFVLGDPKLSDRVKSMIIDPGNRKLVSPVTPWEVAIKVSRGQYSLTNNHRVFFEMAMTINGFEELPISVRHTEIVQSLPFHHKDPFDRLLIAQAMGERIPIVSRDPLFDTYGVSRKW